MPPAEAMNRMSSLGSCPAFSVKSPRAGMEPGVGDDGISALEGTRRTGDARARNKATASTRPPGAMTLLPRQRPSRIWRNWVRSDTFRGGSLWHEFGDSHLVIPFEPES